jgi:surface antigen
VTAFIVINYTGSSAANGQPLTSSNAVSSTTLANNPLDQVASADIAVTVAQMTSLPETVPITNQADSENADLATAPTSIGAVPKAQVVASAFKSNKDIQSYTSVAGDTLSGLAAKFGVTSDSIRWSNSLPSTDALTPGTKLLIPPVNGIIYTVKTGDTAATLAQKYNANSDLITAFNDGELAGLKVGEQIVIPDATQPVIVAASQGSAAASGVAIYGSYNGYDPGYCTWWVAKLRQEAGDPVPVNLGNAATWVIRARADGLATGSVPQVGAAAVLSTRGEGHVGYVTAVNSDGTFTVSEMNHEGYYVKDVRTLADSSSYGFVY